MPSNLRRKLTDYNNPNSRGSRLRARRARPIIALIEAAHHARGSCRILDVGGTPTYWGIVPRELLRQKKVRIVLLNLKAFEIDPAIADIFESVAGDACSMPEYRDAEFDLVHSNSVIEHVGLWDNMQRMANEVRRVGRAYYLQTPNYWFPIEPHYLFPFLHWMPFPWRINLALRMRLGSWPRATSVAQAAAAQQAAILLNTKMMRALFPDAHLSKERVLGLAKSLIAIRAETSAQA
jgi:hypothetical protein